MGELEPIVKIVADEARGFVRAVDDRNLRLVDESLSQSVGGVDRKAVAQHIDKKCWFNRSSADRAWRARRLGRYEIAHRLVGGAQLGRLCFLRLIGLFAPLLKNEVKRALAPGEYRGASGRIEKQCDSDDFPCAGKAGMLEHACHGLGYHLDLNLEFHNEVCAIYASSTARRASGSHRGSAPSSADRRAMRPGRPRRSFHPFSRHHSPFSSAESAFPAFA